MENSSNIWFEEPLSPGLLQRCLVSNIVCSTKSKYQTIEIIDTEPFGRCLIIDGKTQSSQEDEFIFHEALVHPSILTHPGPETVFIAGGGEGATLREVLAHESVKRAVMVDIDEEVVSLSKRYLPSWHQGAFEDPRLELHYADAKEYLANSQEKFDVIIIDLVDPLEEGPTYLLFTQSFYRLVQQRLTTQGIVVVQSECAALGYTRAFTSIAHTLSTVFPGVYPYKVNIHSFGGDWGFVMATQGLSPLDLSPEEVDQRIATRVTRELRLYDGMTHLGMFSLPKYLRELFDKETWVITEENPLTVL
ncbi:MAG: polyamine aminopropyltransferase [Dehalococcoidia bacterium]